MDHLEDMGTADRFRLSLTYRFLAVHELYEDSSTDLEAKWEHTKQTWTDACGEIVDSKTAQHKEWITPAILQKIGIRQDKKASLNNSRSRVARQQPRNSTVKLTER